MATLLNTWKEIIVGISPHELLGKTKKLASIDLPVWMSIDLKNAYQKANQLGRWERFFNKKTPSLNSYCKGKRSIGVVLSIPKIKRAIAGHISIRPCKQGESGGSIVAIDKNHPAYASLHMAIDTIAKFLDPSFASYQHSWVIEIESPLIEFIEGSSFQGKSWGWSFTLLLMGYCFGKSTPKNLALSGEWEQEKACLIQDLDLKVKALHLENMYGKNTFSEIWVPWGSYWQNNAIEAPKIDICQEKSKLTIVPLKEIKDLYKKLPSQKNNVFASTLFLIVIVAFLFFFKSNIYSVKYSQKLRNDKPLLALSYPRQNDLFTNVQKLREQQISSQILIKALLASLKELDKINVQPLKIPYRFPAEVFLELTYLVKLREKTSDSDLENLIQKKWQKISVNHSPQINLEYGALDYSPAYTQWLALFLYAFNNNKENIWLKNGIAQKHVKKMVEISKKWSNKPPYVTKRHRIDGSIAQLGMYVLVSLYLKDKPIDSLGLSMHSSRKLPYKQPGVVLLNSLCLFVENCYPSGHIPITLGMKYSYNSSEGTNLAGGKILYFVSKAILAREQGHLKDMTVYLEKAWQIVFLLQKQKKTLTDTYAIAHALKGIFSLIHLDLKVSGKSKIILSATQIAMSLVSIAQKDKVEETISKWYRPLAILVYETEIRKIIPKFKDILPQKQKKHF